MEIEPRHVALDEPHRQTAPLRLRSGFAELIAGAIEAHDVVASAGEQDGVRPGPAAEVEDRRGLPARELAEQGLQVVRARRVVHDVLVDRVVVSGGPTVLGHRRVEGLRGLSLSHLQTRTDRTKCQLLGSGHRRDRGDRRSVVRGLLVVGRDSLAVGTDFLAIAREGLAVVRKAFTAAPAGCWPYHGPGPSAEDASQAREGSRNEGAESRRLRTGPGRLRDARSQTPSGSPSSQRLPALARRPKDDCEKLSSGCSERPSEADRPGHLCQMSSASQKFAASTRANLNRRSSFAAMRKAIWR